MTAQQMLDTELERRQLPRLKPATVVQVRRLCRHPETAIEILYDRLLLGCQVLDQRETENHWELFELLITAYRCCQIALDHRWQESEQAEIAAIQTDPERQEQVRRRKAVNHRSTTEYLQREAGGQQVPLTEPDNRQPTLIRRQRRGTQS